jgi:hypothetical protein
VLAEEDAELVAFGSGTAELCGTLSWDAAPLVVLLPSVAETGSFQIGGRGWTSLHEGSPWSVKALAAQAPGKAGGARGWSLGAMGTGGDRGLVDGARAAARAAWMGVSRI